MNNYTEKELAIKLPENLLSNTLIYDADTFADIAHRKQKRKYTNLPYIAHPRQVACMLSFYNMEIPLIVAGLLHDVIEDTDYTYDDIKYKFGEEVATLVQMVTNVSKPIDGNRKIRKEIDKQHILSGNEKSKIIKCIDIYCNALNIMESDKSFAKVWLKEKQDLLKDLKIDNKEILNLTKNLVDTSLSLLESLNENKQLLNR